MPFDPWFSLENQFFGHTCLEMKSQKISQGMLKITCFKKDSGGDYQSLHRFFCLDLKHLHLFLVIL